MEKIKIKVIILGHIPVQFSKKKLLSWKSDLFNIEDNIDEYKLTCDSDLPEWQYSDELILKQFPNKSQADFIIALTNVPLEYDWYTRRLSENKVIFTFHEIKDFLYYENIPVENVVLRVLYAYSLAYRSSNNKIPTYETTPGFTHDETKGCLFDMNGIKTDIVESCNNPIICSDCGEKLSLKKIPVNVISTVRREIRKIRKTLYYRCSDFIKAHPIISFLASSIFVVILGIIGSLIATYLYEKIKFTL